MNNEYLMNAFRNLPKPVKPKIPKAAVVGFIVGGAAVAAAATAVGYFFLKKKEITLHLCCDMNDHDEEECRFEEEPDAHAAEAAEKPVADAPAEVPVEAEDKVCEGKCDEAPAECCESAEKQD